MWLVYKEVRMLRFQLETIRGLVVACVTYTRGRQSSDAVAVAGAV